MKNTIALFPGQGSQKVGMGKDLLEASPIAADLFSRARAALGFDLAAICFDGPEERLTATAIAQPAILTISTICFEMAKEHSLRFECAAGHSLGEYSALVAAGAICFDDAVVLVHKRGTYMQEAVPAGAGKMIAILGKEIADIEQAIAQVETGIAQIANDNSPGQVVVAGDADGIDSLQKVLAGSKIIELKVSAPFHCALMKQAEINLRKDLAQLSIKPPTFPIISNFHARALMAPDDIREALALQVCGRVRWVECMNLAATQYQITRGIEFGAGNVLTGLLKRINPAVERITAGNPADLASLGGEAR